MSRKATVISVLALCLFFALFLVCRLAILSSQSGISVAVSSRASEEEIMTPGSGRASRKAEIPTVNINSCSSAELQLLPGVGPVLADAVSEYRSEYGPFLRAEDIMNVPGIGEGVFEQIKDYIYIEE